MCAVQFLLLPGIIAYRIGYWAINRPATMRIDTRRGAQYLVARLRGLSIGIVINNRVRVAVTIACCATDMLAKVYIRRYLGHKHNLKITPNRLSFEEYLFVATNQYRLVYATGVR